MRVLLIGSGGREHAIAWRLGRSNSVSDLHAVPGSDAISKIAHCHDQDLRDLDGLCAFIETLACDLVVIGPEAPLVAGLADRLRAKGVPTLGPNAAAAQLEGSKQFAKELMDAAGVPTAAWASFDKASDALAYLASGSGPIVVKADGLAAGKGVTVCGDREQAAAAVRACFEGRFGSAGTRVVIEEMLTGQELSFIALSDGVTTLPLASSQDHKRLGDGDLGPNTGGMGALSPSPIFSKRLGDEVMERVMRPVIAELAQRGRPFNGFLYAGLMVEGDRFKVLEFNVRCGDPETQALMARFTGDLGIWLLAAARGELGALAGKWDGAIGPWDARDAVGVVLASAGYPADARSGDVISGIEQAELAEGVKVFHAGTRAGCGGWETGGGRVLCVTALGAGLEQASKRAYQAVERIHFEGQQRRNDIVR